jgi:integrase/recombinase XerD
MDTTGTGDTTPRTKDIGSLLDGSLEMSMQMPRWEAIALAYLAEAEQRTGSIRTPREYGRYIARFLADVDDPATVTPAHVHGFAYGKGLSGKAPSPSTVSVRLAALRGFYDFARRMRMIDRNPADDVKRPRNSDPTPRGLTGDELRRLLAETGNTPAGVRDRALIITAVLTGLRRAEVLALRAGDLELRGASTYYHVRTKGGAQRFRELPAPALHAICDALTAQRTPLETLPAGAPLFAISSHGFYKNLRAYAKRAGLSGVTPHALRHSAAKLRRDSGASIEDVGSFLGHRSLHTTSRYLQRLEGEHDAGWHGAAAALGVL